jgi:Caspase domain/Effector Associated Constant Component 1
MTDPMARLTLRIEDAQADPEEVASLTARLRRELLDLGVAAERVPAGPPPPGARSDELAALGALVVTILESNVLAAVVNTIGAWLAGRRQRSVKLEIDGDVLEVTGVPSREQRRLTEAWLDRRAAGQQGPDGSRSALIVASYDYQDPGLSGLRAPARDAEALAEVLRDADIGGFQVRTVLNEPAHLVNLAVEEFFADRGPDDLLLVHFSGHGVKDEDGELYFATTDTRLRRLAATAVGADYVNRRMNRTRSRRVVLLLDCCYAGAFERGMTARAGTGVDIGEQLGGRGRAVITASTSMEYAFEGDQLADARDVTPSVFTSALVEGLATGEADRDQDGLIALDELYEYVYDKVRETTPNQTPSKWTFGVQGDLHIARRSRPVTRPAPLPAELQEALDHPLVGIRAGAIQELERVLHGRHAGLALAARQALERMLQDDSRSVATRAAAALDAEAPHTPPPPPVAVPVVATRVTAPVDPVPQPVDPSPEPLAPVGPPHGVASIVAGGDRLLNAAGGLAILSAVLLIIGLLGAYQWGESLAAMDGGNEQFLPAYVLILAFMAAGSGAVVLVPGRRLIGAGVLLGVAAAAIWGLAFHTAALAVRDGLESGFWSEFVAHLLLLLAAGLTVAALVRAGEVRLAPRPLGRYGWLVALLGLASAAALFAHSRVLSYMGFTWSGYDYDSLAPWACAIAPALVLPAFAAVTAPRRFAIALLGGWLGGAAGILLYGYLYMSDQIANGNDGANRGPLIAFGCTLIALLGAAVVVTKQDQQTSSHPRSGAAADAGRPDRG